MFEPYTLVKIKFIPSSPYSVQRKEEEEIAFGIFKRIAYGKHRKSKMSKMYFEVDTIIPTENCWNFGDSPEFLDDAHLSLSNCDFEQLSFDAAPDFIKELLLSPTALTHKCSGIRVLARRLQNAI